MHLAISLAEGGRNLTPYPDARRSADENYPRREKNAEHITIVPSPAPIRHRRATARLGNGQSPDAAAQLDRRRAAAQLDRRRDALALHHCGR